MGVFLSGVQLSAQSRDLTAATELGHQVMEQIKFNVKKGGFTYLPGGPYTFDGSVPSAQGGAAPLLFPPAPYPGMKLSNTQFTVLVTGDDISPTLKSVTVEVVWSPTSRIKLETHFHP